MTIRFVVKGPPVPQGSMAAIKTKSGKVAVIHSKRGKGRTVAQWRRAAKQEAHLVMRGRALMDGPTSVEATFYVQRPVSRLESAFPDTKPDLDKLCRALGDALEGIVVTQDSRIVHWSARKLYADEHPTGVPCSVVSVESILSPITRHRPG